MTDADGWISYEMVVFHYYGDETVVHPANRHRSAIWRAKIGGLDPTSPTPAKYDIAKQAVRDATKGHQLVVNEKLAIGLLSRALITMTEIDGSWGERVKKEVLSMAQVMKDRGAVSGGTLNQQVSLKVVAFIDEMETKITGLLKQDESGTSIMREIEAGATAPASTEDPVTIARWKKDAEKWQTAQNSGQDNLSNMRKYTVASSNRLEIILATYRNWLCDESILQPPSVPAVIDALIGQRVDPTIRSNAPFPSTGGLISNAFPNHLED